MRRYVALLVAVALALIAAGVFIALRRERHATPAPGRILWRGDFETGNLSQWSFEPQEKEPGRITVVRSPTRQGRFAARVELEPGDDHVVGSGEGERAELLTDDAVDRVPSRDEWLAFSTMFDPKFRPVPNTYWNDFLQFHQTAADGQASAFRVYNSTIVLTVYGGDPAAPTDRTWMLDRNRENGVWYDFLVHVRWSSDSAIGFIEVWMSRNGADPAKVVPSTHLSTLYDGMGVYLKEGYYRAAYGAEAVLYLDGARVTTGYPSAVAAFPDGEWPSTPPA